MSVFSKLVPKQSCVLCAEPAEFCVCPSCQSELETHQKRCKSCAIRLTTDLDFCGQCLAHAPTFRNSYTLFEYNAVCAELIKSFKFEHKLCVGDYLAHRLFVLYQTIPQEYDAIIPMPLSQKRAKERGFNQVLELLRSIRKNSNIMIDSHSVKRIKATQPLSLLSAEQRKKEIKGAFEVASMPYKKVLLVDDVMTTGSSLNELAKTILAQSNVKICDVMTLARAETSF